MEFFNKANSLFIDEEYADALQEYSKAIEQDESNAEYYVKRAICHLKLNDNKNALQDAKRAIELDPKNKQAHFRVGIAKFQLEEYESAKASFEEAYKLQNTVTIRRWIRKCDAEIENEERDENNENSVDQVKLVQNEKNEDNKNNNNNDNNVIETKKKEKTKIIKTPQPDTNIEYDYGPFPSSKIRHEWYQNIDYINITIFTKDVKPEDCDIHFTNKELSVNIKLPTGKDYMLMLDLCAEVIPADCKYQILDTKVEIKLKKEKSLKWASLEKIDSQFALQEFQDASKVNKNEYPTSSKKKVDWNAIVKEDEPEEDQPLNKVFQDIFARGSSEQQRAMMKSFYESGGTVLSTNWDDIGARKVECTAPKGMEVHHWNELTK